MISYVMIIIIFQHTPTASQKKNHFSQLWWWWWWQSIQYKQCHINQLSIIIIINLHAIYRYLPTIKIQTSCHKHTQVSHVKTLPTWHFIAHTGSSEFNQWKNCHPTKVQIVVYGLPSKTTTTIFLFVEMTINICPDRKMNDIFKNIKIWKNVDEINNSVFV